MFWQAVNDGSCTGWRANMKVIVVDDSLVMRKIIAGVVKELGHEPLHAANGQHLFPKD